MVLVNNTGPCGNVLKDSQIKASVERLADGIFETMEKTEVYLRMSDIGENADQVIYDMLILDNQEGGKARNMLLNKDMKYFGAACNCHSMYEDVCCIILTDDSLKPKPLAEQHIKNVTKFKDARTKSEC